MIEKLEHRTLLAVDVSVDLTGTLIIEGADDDDMVTVTGIGTGTGNYDVTTAQGSQTVSGVTGGIAVNLGDGGNTLVMNLVYVAGIIDIRTGAGADMVVLGDQDVVSSAGDLRIDLGGGSDRLDGKRLYIGASQFINGGDGDDELIFDGFLSPQFTLGTSAAGNVAWSGGAGNDTVHVIYGFVVGAMVIDLGDGGDALTMFGSAISGDVIYLGGAGNDGFNVDTNFFDANMRIEGNVDGDTVFVANGLGTEIALVQTHDGGDFLTVVNHTAVQLHIDAGAGDDVVEFRSSAFDVVFAQMGDGNDMLTARGNLVRILLDIEGGLGESDQFSDLGNTLGAFQRRCFELSAHGPVTITKVATETIQLRTQATTPYNILLATASGGFEPYTFTLDSGIGFQPLGMQLVTVGNQLFLQGIPSPGSESPFARQFGVCVKDLAGNSDCVDMPFSYVVDGTVVGPTLDTTGIWSGFFSQSNPLGTQSGAMTLNLTANPAFTTVVTGTITLSGSGTRTLFGTVNGSDFVFNIQRSPGFIIHQLTGTVTVTTMSGDSLLIDTSGGETTGNFNLNRQ
ncbi:MAG: hypothetical protein WD894_22225 [Pirellulales bacterium]